MKKEPIVKTYDFSTEERNKLSDIQIGMISFQNALEGMELRRQIVLGSAYDRVGAVKEEKEGYEKHFNYNLGTGKITVTFTPKEEKKEEPTIILPNGKL